VDYIVVHEMTHMIEKNHTPEFWHIIGLILPDYETRKEWLDKNGKDLDI
jgi:predicted metal-dependent hydrolase